MTPSKVRAAALVDAMPPSGIRRFFDLVAQMDDVISLGVGEPDFVTPWRIREAAIWAIEHGATSYTSNWGTLELRKTIARYLERTYGVSYNPENEILVTVGVSEGLDVALRAILDPGDEVVLHEPCYVSYKPCVSLAGGVPVVVETTPEHGFHLQAKDVRAAVTPKTRALLLNFPNNPTGASLSEEELKGLAAIAEENDLIVLSDEIYDRLTYTGRHTCFASLPGMRDRTILLNGFSKAFAMTGWRIAYAAGPPELLGAMCKVHQYTMLCAPNVAQHAAVEALRNGLYESDEMVESYSQRRRLMVAGLNRIGLNCHLPEGAFYAFPSIRSTGLSSEAFAERLLKEERVAVVPGTAFGPCGEGSIRCAYAASLEGIQEAISRMDRFVHRHATEAAHSKAA
jgi:aminotransferase